MHLCKAERLKQGICLIRRRTKQRIRVCGVQICVYVLTAVFMSMCFHLSVRASVCVGVMIDASLLSIANRIVMVTEHILYHLPCN